MNITNVTESFASCSSKFDTQGGLVLYLLVVLVLCVALGLLCEHAFSASILSICARLRLSDDVAGATLMAAGTSAPELFISLFSLRAPSVVPGEVVSDAIGAGAIVGSAIFNLAVIIGLSMLVSPAHARQLNYKSLLRDILCNLVCVVFVVGVFSHTNIRWYDAVVALALYVLYVVLMKYNSRLISLCSRVYSRCRGAPAEQLIILSSDDEEDRQQEEDEEQQAEMMEMGGDAMLATREAFLDSPSVSRRVLRKSLSKQNASQVSAPLLDGLSGDSEYPEDEDLLAQGGAEAPPRFREWKYGIHTCTDGLAQVTGWTSDASRLHKAWVVVCAPFNLLFHYTIPESDNPTWGGRLCWVAFAVCLAYLGLITAVLIHVVGKVGCLLHFSDSVTGATLLAVATSMPDCLTSVFMARRGRTSMAISNALGSNVFDVFIALGIPWMFASVIGWPIVVSGDGVLAYCIIFTVSLVVLSVCALAFKSTVRPAWGFTLLAVYMLFLVYVGLDDALLFPWSAEY